MTRAAATDAPARAALVARASYGRLVAMLAAGSGDLAAAEDALSDALVAALTHWPDRGIPDNPEAWLVRVARNRLTDAHRRALRRNGSSEDDEMSFAPQDAQPAISDPRLALMFVCAHPAIAPPARAPLMLQTVLGFTAAEIARAYTQSPAALSKLLGRAKARIKVNAIPFRLPEGADLPARIDDVCEAIYGTYSLAWLDSEDARDMQREAVFLADLLCETLPDEPEILGLAALLEYLHARQGARLVEGCYVPLDQQHTGLWDHLQIARAEARLRRAATKSQIGRFQLEAAIQGVHAARARTGKTDWKALSALYAGLVRMAPTLGALVSQAAVAGRIEGPFAGMALLDRLSESEVRRFQPFWATRAHLLAQSGASDQARIAYARAIGLTQNAPQRRWLQDQLARLEGK